MMNRESRGIDPRECQGAITFFVPGVPAPGGSKRAFAHARTGKIVVLDDAKGNKQWRDCVASFATWEVGSKGALTGPLEVEFTFTLPRPKCHFGSGRNSGKLLRSAPKYPTTRPDTSKLIRSCEDALTSICWHDDAQIVVQTARKVYGPSPGVRVAVRRLGDGDGERC